jgi:alpha-galactosidase
MINKMKEVSYFQKPGSWGKYRLAFTKVLGKLTAMIADMDLLQIGNGAMTEFQEQTQFSFWAALKSPLIASTPLGSIGKSSLNILLNREIIAISQDDAGAAVNYVPELSIEGSIQVWAGPLKSGSSRFVILAFNESNVTKTITIPLEKVPGLGKHGSRVRDVWNKTSLRIEGEKLQLGGVQPYQTKVLVFSQ